MITGTQSPVWEEHFFYEDLDENELATRVLEVKEREKINFLGKKFFAGHSLGL